jgi:carbon storage regulator
MDDIAPLAAAETEFATTQGKTMLVLSRKTGERIRIGEDVTITVVRIAPHGVRIGIDAPGHMAIVREELGEDLEVAKPASASTSPKPR